MGPWRLLGSSLGGLEDPWGTLGTYLGPSWHLLNHLEAFWSIWRPPGKLLWGPFGWQVAHLGSILDDVGSILESFLTFSKSYLKVRVFCVFLGWRCSSLWKLTWPPEVSTGALQEETPKVFMMAPEMAKLTFCHLLVLQCPNFIHHVLSLVLLDLFLI